MMNISVVLFFVDQVTTTSVLRADGPILDGPRDIGMALGADITLLQRDTISEFNEFLQVTKSTVL